MEVTVLRETQGDLASCHMVGKGTTEKVYTYKHASDHPNQKGYPFKYNTGITLLSLESKVRST
jgi:hypothetical protein